MTPPSPERAHEPVSSLPDLAGLRRAALEIGQALVLAIVLFAALTTWVVQPVEVELTSMQPTLAPRDHLLVDRLTLRWDELDRGELIVFDAPAPYGDDGVPYVKRVIGLPGDVVLIESGAVFVGEDGGPPRRLDEPWLRDGGPTLPQGLAAPHSWIVPDGEVFVLGDNRTASVDSRTFGPIARERIVGRAWLRYLPVERFGPVGSPVEP